LLKKHLLQADTQLIASKQERQISKLISGALKQWCAADCAMFAY